MDENDIARRIGEGRTADEEPVGLPHGIEVRSHQEGIPLRNPTQQKAKGRTDRIPSNDLSIDENHDENLVRLNVSGSTYDRLRIARARVGAVRGEGRDVGRRIGQTPVA
jgi:hypothetical protein